MFATFVTWLCGTDPGEGENPYKAPALRAEPTSSKEDKAENQLDMVVAHAEVAWALPRSYFKEMLARPRDNPHWRSKYPDVDNATDRHSRIEYQCPLYNIMAGCHSSYTEELREQLWAHPGYRQAVAHVFHNVSAADALSAASHMEAGYNGPITDTIVRAAKEGLFGLRPVYRSWVGTNGYDPGRDYPDAVSA